MNDITITGNLTRDPVLRTTNSGVKVCDFFVSVNYYEQEDKQKTDYFQVAVWREDAETCFQYLKKGYKVSINGSLRTKEYTGRDGTLRTVLEISAKKVDLISTQSKRTLVDSMSDEQIEAKFKRIMAREARSERRMMRDLLY